MAGTEADAAEGASPMRGARGAQELLAQTSAFIEDLSARDSAFAASFIPSLESNLLSGIKAAGVPDGVYAAVVASVRTELKSAAAALERRRGENAELAYRMQQKVVTVAQESGAVAASTQPSGGGSSEMEVDGQSKAAERERLAAAVASLTKQLEESKGLQAKAAEALKSAQAKAEQLEAERAMSAVAINDGARVASVAASVQVRLRCAAERGREGEGGEVARASRRLCERGPRCGRAERWRGTAAHLSVHRLRSTTR